MNKRGIVLLTVLIMTLTLFFSPVSSAQDDISSPEYTNELIGEVNTPKIEPGNSGDIILRLKNPYEPDITIKNVTFEMEIYNCIYLDKNKSISDVRNPPTFSNGDIKQSSSIDKIESGGKKELTYSISSSEQTEEGVYSIRFKLTFWQQGNKEVMMSRGYFSTSELEEARGSSGNNSSKLGGYNTSMLEVSGILPETSFTVRKKIPRWPQYALGLITGVSGLLAVMFYMQEKYDSFPWLEDAFENWTRKFKEFGRRFQKRFDNS